MEEAHIPQSVQTNQLLFPHYPTDAPPTTLLLTTGNGAVDVAEYPAKDGQLNVLHSLHGHTSAALSLALSPTGRYLAIGGTDALISLWDTQEWVCRRTLAGMQGIVKTVSFSWDGSFLAGGSDEGTGIEIVSSFSVSRRSSLPPSCCVSIPEPTLRPSLKCCIATQIIRLTEKSIDDRHTLRPVMLFTPYLPPLRHPAWHGIRSGTGWLTLAILKD